MHKPSIHRDLSSYAGAAALAQSLTAYWRSRGYPEVTFTVERVEGEGANCVFAVKSNLKDGLPPGGVPESTRL